MIATMWAASIASRGLAGTIRAVLLWALAIFLLLLIGWGLLSGRFWAWRAEFWKERAVEAADRAAVAERQAESTEQGAANATYTRQQMDAGTVTVRIEAEESAQRIEAHVPSNVDRAAEPDADVLRELEAADRAYRAAADRLQ